MAVSARQSTQEKCRKLVNNDIFMAVIVFRFSILSYVCLEIKGATAVFNDGNVPFKGKSFH